MKGRALIALGRANEYTDTEILERLASLLDELDLPEDQARKLFHMRYRLHAETGVCKIEGHAALILPDIGYDSKPRQFAQDLINERYPDSVLPPNTSEGKKEFLKAIKALESFNRLVREGKAPSRQTLFRQGKYYD